MRLRVKKRKNGGKPAQAIKPAWSLKKRLLAALSLVIALFVVLAGWLLYVQIIWGPELQRMALNQWTRTTSLTAARGDILDVNGNVLATNGTVYKVVLWPSLIDSSDRERISAELSSLLGMDYDVVLDRVSSTQYRERILKRQISVETRDAVDALQLGKGVGTALDSKRYYPNGTLFSQIIGFTNIDNVGQSGLELSFDKYLSGVNGKQIAETDSSGNTLAYGSVEYIDPIDGYDIVLTGDSVLESYLEKALEEALEVNNAKSAQGIIMDCNTGAILAISSLPDYDPNNPPRDDLTLLAELSRNRIVTDSYEPGSTFKIVTLAAAIDSGAVSLDSSFFCNGSYLVNGESIHCWKTAGHGSQTLTKAVENSCNCAFMQMALSMGVEEFYDYIYAFGFGQTTGSGLIGESGGIVTHEKYIKENDLARIGFGQSIAVTPLQLCAAVCAAVNGGYLHEPYIVQRVLDNNGSVVYEADTTPIRQVLSEETSAKVRTILQSVVDNGTGRNCKIEGYNVGGKTGTAQKYDEYGRISAGSYICSFIGFAPAENPQYVCLILVDEPQVSQIFGSTVAAPFVKMVLEDTLHYSGILASHQSQTVEIPNVTGMTTAEAEAALTEKGLCAVFQCDDVVTAQVPSAGSEVVVGYSVLLYTAMTAIDPTLPVDAAVYVTVPDLTGMTPLEAYNALTALGLTFESNADDPSGTAYMQSITPGTNAAYGTAIVVWFRFETDDGA